MPEAKLYCPACSMPESLSFYEGTENGAPHGAGWWPMQTEDVDQKCSCELTPEQWDNAKSTAWALQSMVAMHDEQAAVMRAVRTALIMPDAKKALAWLELVIFPHDNMWADTTPPAPDDIPYASDEDLARDAALPDDVWSNMIIGPIPDGLYDSDHGRQSSHP
jgi:hypothetical protein